MAKSPEVEHPHKAFGWAAKDSSGVLSPFHFSRRDNGVEDVTIKILYCGVCHSDLHAAKNEWGFSRYPLVPGHEIVGIVTKIGSNVKKFKVDDQVGVGVLVNSCKSCEYCDQDLENYCPKMIFTYNAQNHDGTKTYGGYSDTIVVDQHFVLRIPDSMPADGAAPLLCAGITVYSPMKYYGMTEPGKHLGIVGLGGLGHVAVKIGKAFGLKVTVISSSSRKESEALDRLGADSFLVSSDPEKMKAAFGTMDYIIDTVSAVHALAADKLTGDALLGLFVVAVAHAFVVAVMISAGHISGGHLNPAVTIGLLFGGHITVVRSILYWIDQLLASTAACFLLKYLTGGLATPVHTLASGMDYLQGVVWEIVLTFSLLFTVYATIVDPKKGSIDGLGPMLTGFVVGANILAGGAFSGASMNPARSFGPALVSWDWTDHWVYWVGPLIGGGLAGFIYENFFITRSHRPLPSEEEPF